MRILIAVLGAIFAVQGGELHQAAQDCDAERMRQLLAQKPGLNEPDDQGRTPLHIAVDFRQVRCVGLLLEAGADRRVKDQQGRTPFDAARQIADVKERSTILLYLTWGSGKRMPEGPTGPPPWSLEHSVLHRQTNVTKMLLAMGVDPNAAGSAGATPLADAALKGDIEGVRALLAHGAKPGAVSQSGTQPIHDAALGDNSEVIRELVLRGADVNARTREDAQTPLHLAAAMGKMNAVKTLIELGADLTAKDSKGRSAVDAAERVGLTDVALFLRQAATGR